MGDNLTIRRTPENQKILDLIREHLAAFIGKPTDTDCADFALRAAKREIEGTPKPRHPKAHKP